MKLFSCTSGSICILYGRYGIWYGVGLIVKCPSVSSLILFMYWWLFSWIPRKYEKCVKQFSSLPILGNCHSLYLTDVYVISFKFCMFPADFKYVVHDDLHLYKLTDSFIFLDNFNVCSDAQNTAFSGESIHPMDCIDGDWAQNFKELAQFFFFFLPRG